MSNLKADTALRWNFPWTVHHAVDEIGLWDVDMNQAVNRAVDWAVGAAVSGARDGSGDKDPQHPSLQDFLDDL